MRRRGYFVFAFILALMLVGCGSKDIDKTGDIRTEEKAESSDTIEKEAEKNETEPIVEENVETVQEPDKTANDLNTGTSTKPSSGSTTKPSTGATGNSDSANNSGSAGNTSNNTAKPNTEQPPENTTTPVHEHTWVEVTGEVKHYYDWRTICGKCNADLTDMSADDRTYHIVAICGGGYSVKLVEVNYVTENIKTETIVTGYKCSCGEVKEHSCNSVNTPIE